MSDKNFGYLGTTFQQQLLKTIIEDKKFAITIVDSIDSKYFDGPYFKYLMENIKELYRAYGVIPDYVTLEQKILKENKDVSSKINLDTLHTIRDMEPQNDGFVQETSLNFCRQQVLKKSLKEVEEIMTQGDFENYHKIEEIVQKALQVGASTDSIVDVCSNVRESLQDGNRVPYPTGITGLDSLLKGGMAKGEFGVFIAPTGVGKTTFLTKVANTAYNCGANVLQIFFEDSLNAVRRKHYTIWTGYNEEDQKKNEDEVVTIVEGIGKRNNFLKLLKLPAYGTTVNDIKGKVRKLASEGLKIDVMIIDYLECISGESHGEGEEWKGEGTIARSLESMKDEFDIAIWAGTQGNRESISSEVVTTDQIGGSIKKAQIGTIVISAGKTLEQKEHNLATVTLLKSRIGKDGIVFQNCKFNNEYLDIDTDTQNTLLGHEEEKQEAKKQRAGEVFRADIEKQRQIIEARVDKLMEAKTTIINEVHQTEQPPESLDEIGAIELKDDGPTANEIYKAEANIEEVHDESVLVELEVTMQSSVSSITSTFTPTKTESPPSTQHKSFDPGRAAQLARERLSKSKQNSS